MRDVPSHPLVAAADSMLERIDSVLGRNEIPAADALWFATVDEALGLDELAEVQ